ncbi:MAG: O-antigen ligase family protein [Campylobacterota bacterium]
MLNFKNKTLDDYINYIFVLYAFLVPISRAGIVLTTLLLFVLWFFTDNFKQKISYLKSNSVVKYLTFFIAFGVLSLLWTDDVGSGINYIRRFWYLLPILVIATSIKKEYIPYAISAFLVGMFISEVLSYGLFFELWTLSHGSPSDPSPFMNHLQYSMFLAFASLLLLNRFFFEAQLKYKIFYFLYFLTVSSNLFLNGGRTGQVAFAVSLILVGLLNIKNKVVALLSMSLLVVSIFYTAYQVSPVFESRVDMTIKNISSIENENFYCSSLGKRLGQWSVGSEIFLDNPIGGIGISKNTETMKRYIDESHPDKACVKNLPNYHNYYVQMAVKLGIIGLFLYLMIFYSILKLDIKNRQNYNLMVIFVTVYAVSSLFENMFHQQFSEAIFALFVGIFIAQSRLEKESKV